ncbi:MULTISPECIES: hypothetical protein [unclassified Microcoleus]|uniref:hypothetical protein n=1 Tax=unclassified Microcoleus TaxID=2642155 RepID=UPI002FD39617
MKYTDRSVGTLQEPCPYNGLPEKCCIDRPCVVLKVNAGRELPAIARATTF